MEGGLALGKLPPELMARLLGGVPRRDARVLVGASLGVDAAAVSFGERLLIATADPITFTGERIGWYAVNVNANDIAVMGGVPRWFLATLLLPAGIAESDVAAIFADLTAACDQFDVTLIGGHTEVTSGLDRPILCGTMLGEAPAGRMITSAGVQPGDRILFVGMAVEGTAVLATAARAELLAAGVTEDELAAARALLHDPGISVVRAARVLTDAVPVHAMHDATEGGIATAIQELANASGVGVLLDRSALPFVELTTTICAALGLDPLGLLASGCLIAAVTAADTATAVAAVRAAGLRVSLGGSATTDVRALRMHNAGGVPADMPTFARDEMARWLEKPTPRPSQGQGDARSAATG